MTQPQIEEQRIKETMKIALFQEFADCFYLTEEHVRLEFVDPDNASLEEVLYILSQY